MKFKQFDSENEISSRIDMTPLIDIVFQLIIFFMLTSNFAIQSGIRVKLPSARTAEGITIDQINITINKERKIQINGEEVGLDQLAQAVLALHKKYPAAGVNLAADGSVFHEDVIRVMDVVRRENITKISIQTEPLRDEETQP